MADPHPAGTLLGVGITAHDVQDALLLLETRVCAAGPCPAVASIEEDVDIRTLDEHHVLPNIGNVLRRGVWFPPGYE